MSRIILHVDMDSLYASVEQRRDSSLKGLTVVMGSDPKSGNGRAVGHLISQATEIALNLACPNRSRATRYNN